MTEAWILKDTASGSEPFWNHRHSLLWNMRRVLNKHLLNQCVLRTVADTWDPRCLARQDPWSQADYHSLVNWSVVHATSGSQSGTSGLVRKGDCRSRPMDKTEDVHSSWKFPKESTPWSIIELLEISHRCLLQSVCGLQHRTGEPCEGP